MSSRGWVDRQTVWAEWQGQGLAGWEHSPAPEGRWAPASSGTRGLPWPPGPGAGAHWTRSAPRASLPPATHKHHVVRLGGQTLPTIPSPSLVSKASGGCQAGNSNTAYTYGLATQSTQKLNTFLTWLILTLWTQRSPVYGHNMIVSCHFWTLGFCS